MPQNSIAKNYYALTRCIYLLNQGFDNIFIPLKNSYFYDLVAEKNNELLKIKVVYTNTKSPTGVYVATLRKCGKNQLGKVSFQPFDSKTCDLIFIATPDKSYLIPSSGIKNTRSISMCMFENFQIIPS